jgi:hypothetical protein
MKTATALVLVAIGAIFAFAITHSPEFLRLHVVGWVLMLTGAAGALIPRRGSGWRRRRVVVSNEETAEPRPAGEPKRFSRILAPGGLIGVGSRRNPVPPGAEVQQETIEEFIEE